MATAFNKKGVYVVTPDYVYGTYLGLLVEEVLRGGAIALQYRTKEASDQLADCQLLKALCDGFQVPFIVNDDPELVTAVSAQGIHLENADINYATAREAVGNQGIVGVSCGFDLKRAREAEALGADYVVFGDIVASADAVAKPVDKQLIKEARQSLTLSIVVAEDVSLEETSSLLEAGSDCVAISHVAFAEYLPRDIVKKYVNSVPVE